ncbi:VOC family protein [Fimbriimonas ginsengisoli]|uniref:Glyoxalase/bleomycin resistance protein/dioxygenase n=1 Tax=Fimbriimonas ginsengisoli Gsoil 348 TaxID=661478 RepID=A0A068NT75_FIMGI|nr:VOC family protein [Fimbriimonas ginsengisoli]AIE85970.1 glyoxalase/bleomycin resistance protein/dioxygenase [Fimbriimonas ginsengisoli Gsoil 348]
MNVASYGEMASPAFSIDAKTQLGEVALVVGDLQRSIAFYTDVIGLVTCGKSVGDAILGTPEGRVLVRLREVPGALPRIARTTGLYHFAILVPSRVDLAHRLKRIAETRTRLQGAADHRVSEALYLEDPDGNGVELYYDRPRGNWIWLEGRVQMDTRPLDFRKLLDELEREPPQYEVPIGTRIGHIHLHVSNLKEAIRFYTETVGFRLVAAVPGAAFVSAGGYHHHIGLNTWGGSTPPAPESAGLDYFELVLPEVRALNFLVQSARFRRARFDDDWDGLLMRDPFGNRIVLKSLDQ